ncbi:MAG TPA: HAD family phosphatase [Candidatus Paceibacterota bacterium]
MIKNFVFDVGEVLFCGIKPLYLRINEHLNPPNPLTNADLYNSIYIRLYMRGSITEEQLWRAVIAGFKLTATPARLADMVRKEFVAIEGTLDIVKELRAAGYRIALLSVHGREWVQHLEATHAFHRHFEPGCLCYSCDTSYLKPAPEAYKHVASCLNAPPEECFFVDDHLPNCEAAEKLGFSTHTFTTADDLRRDLKERGLLPRSVSALPS